MRVKGEYIHHEFIKGAMGIKISAPELDNAIAGSEVYCVKNEEEKQEAIETVEGDIVGIIDKYIDKDKNGVCV